MSKTIKIFPNGVDLIIDGESENFDSPLKLWEALGWDIKNDEQASECATIVTRNLYCFGEIDLSSLVEGKHTVIVRVRR